MKLSEKIAVSAVIVTLFKVVVAGLTIKWSTDSITFGTIDSMAIAALLTPTLGAIHLETFVNNKGPKNES